MEKSKRCYYQGTEVIVNAFNMLKDGTRLVLVFIPEINDTAWVPAEALEIREVE